MVFISYTQQIDTSTPAVTLLAAIAEFEREMIRERVKTGMRASYAQIAKKLGLAKSCVFRYTKAEEAFACRNPYSPR